MSGINGVEVIRDEGNIFDPKDNPSIDIYTVENVPTHFQ